MGSTPDPRDFHPQEKRKAIPPSNELLGGIALFFIEASPQTQLSKLVNNYKTVTSRLPRKEFSSALEKYYWKGIFWSDSSFLSTVSETTEEAVRIYIQEQGKRGNEGYRRSAGRRKAAALPKQLVLLWTGLAANKSNTSCIG